MSAEAHGTVIAGAGCAGLSLACHMVKAGLDPHDIVLLDPRTEFPRDRTWCYWALRHHPFQAAVHGRWPCWCVHMNGREIRCRAPDLYYEHVPADAFYREALHQVAGKVELRLGVSVDDIEDLGTHVRIETSDGMLHARRVFDGRPSSPPEERPDEVRLFQHFMGWHVRSRAPVFEPDCVTLMDFDVDQSRGLRFVYVLPFSPSEALVEDTYLSSRTHPTRVYSEGIRSYLHRRWGLEDFEILHRERGALPMSTAPSDPRPSRRVYRIGAAGGLLKPSTGYAFLAIQRYSVEMAARLCREPLPDPPPPRSPRETFLDRVFLAFLHEHPERAPELFARMFEHVPAATLVRFLSDAGSTADALQVMRALPALPMMRQAWKSYPLWLRR